MKKDLYARQKAYHARKPWARHIHWARTRCNNRGHRGYVNHGAKGIKCFLTTAEAEILWKRDGADAMKQPSLDRIESDRHYCIHNCRFLEFFINQRLPHDAELAARINGGEKSDPSWLHEEPVPF